MEKSQLKDEVLSHLRQIYSGHDLKQADDIFLELMKKNDINDFQITQKLTSKNVYLITYGDAVSRKSEAPLATLRKVISKTSPFITDVHILPMFPYTSDDGFSVENYNEINPKLGTWEDVNDFRNDRRLMFDFVANHSSKSGTWFKRFLNSENGFVDAFLVEGKIEDTSKVIRPRVGPLFHLYQRPSGQ